MKKTVTGLLATAVTSLSLFAATTAPASAAPVITGGLVNITITNFLNNNTVTFDRVVNVAAAVNIAANVCGTDVNVLAEQFIQNQTVTCTNDTSGQTVTINQP
jgi:hypothetical protein